MFGSILIWAAIIGIAYALWTTLGWVAAVLMLLAPFVFGMCYEGYYARQAQGGISADRFGHSPGTVSIEPGAKMVHSASGVSIMHGPTAIAMGIAEGRIVQDEADGEYYYINEPKTPLRERIREIFTMGF
jgi:hypothetical protein